MSENLERTVLLTDIKHKEKPFFTLDKYGSFFAERPYVFNSRVFYSKEEANKLIDKLKENEILTKIGVEIKHFNKVSKFHLVHVTGPAEISDILSTKFSSDFIAPHYTEQLRMFANPGTLVEVLDDSLLPNLQLKKEFNERMEKLREKLEYKLYDKKEGFITQTINGLEELTPKLISKKELTPKDIVMFRRVPSELLEESIALYALRERIRNEVSNGDSIFRDNKLEFVFHDLPLKKVRPLSFKEWMDRKWLFEDIERAEYGEKNPRVSDIGMHYIEKGSSTKKQIFSLMPIGKKEVNGYTIIDGAPHEFAQIDASAEDVRKENPLVMVFYNAPYDLLGLKEVGTGYTVGTNKSKPRTEATAVSMKRMAVEGRFVIDLLPWARTIFPGLPSYKLPCVKSHINVRHGLPPVGKDIDYPQLKKNFHAAMKGDAAKALENTIYLTHDCDWTKEIHQSEEFQDTFKLNVEASDDFTVPVERLAFSPNGIDLSQFLSFWQNVGTYMDEIHRKEKKSNEIDRESRKRFKKMLENIIENEGKSFENVIAKKAGTYQKVTIGLVSLGSYLGDLVERRFPLAAKINKKLPSDGRPYYKEHERMYLAQLGNALTKFIVLDDSRLGGLMDKYADEKFMLLPDQERIAKLEKDITKSQKKMLGNYMVSSIEVDTCLYALARRILEFSKNNGMTLIHQEGPLLYFTGGKDAKFYTSPIIKADTIDEVFVSNDWNSKHSYKRKISYQKYGFRKGERRKREKKDMNNLALPFMEV